MSRRGGFSFPRGAGRSAARSRNRNRSRSPSRTVFGAPSPATVYAPRFGGILQDMFFGTGSSAYHKAVNEVIGPHTTHHETFGTGSSAYHKAVNAVIGPHTTHHETLNLDPQRGERPPHALASVADMCAVDAKAFHDCYTSDKSDDGRCKYYLDILTECRRKFKPGGIFGYADSDDEAIPQTN